MLRTFNLLLSCPILDSCDDKAELCEPHPFTTFSFTHISWVAVSDLRASYSYKAHSSRPPSPLRASQQFSNIRYTFLMSVCLSVCLFVCLSVRLPVCLSVCLSVCPSACLSVCLSVCLYASACASSAPGLWMAPSDTPRKSLSATQFDIGHENTCVWNRFSSWAHQEDRELWTTLL